MVESFGRRVPEEDPPAQQLDLDIRPVLSPQAQHELYELVRAVVERAVSDGFEDAGLTFRTVFRGAAD